MRKHNITTMKPRFCFPVIAIPSGVVAVRHPVAPEIVVCAQSVLFPHCPDKTGHLLGMQQPT
jgi:hypothetical protein